MFQTDPLSPGQRVCDLAQLLDRCDALEVNSIAQLKIFQFIFARIVGHPVVPRKVKKNAIESID